MQNLIHTKLVATERPPHPVVSTRGAGSLVVWFLVDVCEKMTTLGTVHISVTSGYLHCNRTKEAAGFCVHSFKIREFSCHVHYRAEGPGDIALGICLQPEAFSHRKMLTFI